MKVILIQPNYSLKATIGPPLGLAYLGTFLEQAGHKVKIIDAEILKYKFDDIKKEITYFDPDVVGVTSSTMYIDYALLIAKFAKENNPNSIIVLGGPHPTVRSQELLENNYYVDVIIKGEGEITFTELLEKKTFLEWKEVKGISFRVGKKIIENINRPPIENLDNLPMPAYHLLRMDKYRIKFLNRSIMGEVGERYIGINTSRGCPYDCIFCSSRALWGRRWRARSPEHVIEEIRFLKDNYKIDIIDFLDDTFSIDIKRVEEICKLINNEKIDVSLVCTTRVDNFNKKLSEILKNAGCKIVFFGLESGVQKTLDYLCKGFTIDDTKNAVKNAKESGLKVAGSFIIGIPLETKDMIYQTINFAKKLKLTTAAFHIFTPFPGTKIYEMAEKKDLLLTHDWSKYNTLNPILKTDNCAPQELLKIHHQANFYYFVKNLLNFK